MKKISPLFVFTILTLAFCLGCQVQDSSPTPTLNQEPTLTAVPNVTPTIAPTVTPSVTPAKVIMLASNEVDPSIAQGIEEKLRSLAVSSGILLETRETIPPSDLSPDVVLTVAIAPYPDLSTLIQSAPESQFLTIGFLDLTPGPNLSVIGPEGYRPDQQGFIAGYLAAVVTEDWRVGVISAADTLEGRNIRQGFINGVRFYCGLCQPIYPPFEGYPLFVEVTSTASRSEWQAAADILLAAAVQTVYVDPGIQDKALYAYLAEAEVNLIGGESPREGLEKYWIASVQSQPGPALDALWPEFERGESGKSLPIPLGLDMVNPDLLSPGRQQLINEIIDELTLGVIDTGIDPKTGERR